MESTINVENVVASTKLTEAFDLPKIEAELEGAEYNKKKFPGLVYIVKAPNAAFLIFTSGKVVCTGSIGFEKIDLEPEQFPGIIYRIKQPKVVVLIFGSGRLVITGGKTPEECEEGARIVRMQLENMGLL
ncbi:MAG: TATA-box-binding protein [Methanothrix sp.]